MTQKNTPDYTKNSAIEGTSDKPHFIGQLPQKKDTVTAEVLRRLFEGERLTSLAGVFEASTTRLGAVVYHLRDCWGWVCETRDKASGCKDGRIAWVTEYRLSEHQRIEAQRPDVLHWCEQVRSARAKRRTQAAKAEHRAAKLNDARESAQWNLFEEGGRA
ncbi:MAG: hypothetical protein BGO13_02500 [Burkholderiales bacterium 66-5]|nr:MAG: hypothetical protein BGO13_02500 [Burkholderiales bacterium 66-5]